MKDTHYQATPSADDKRVAFDRAVAYLRRRKAPRAEMPFYCFHCLAPLLLGMEVESKHWNPCGECGDLLCQSCCAADG